MDDLAQKLAAMLNDPGTIAQVQSIMGALSNGNSAEKPNLSTAENTQKQPVPAESTTAANPLAMLSALSGAAPAGSSPAMPALNTEALGLITRLAPLLSSLQQEDDSTRLLHALRPLLGTHRQQKLDEALRLLQIMRALPLLKQSGILRL